MFADALFWLFQSLQFIDYAA